MSYDYAAQVTCPGIAIVQVGPVVGKPDVRVGSVVP